MSNRTRTIIKTGDGSHSLYVKELDEHYHSIHGAIQEGKHVFIEMGLKALALTNITSPPSVAIGLPKAMPTPLLLPTSRLRQASKERGTAMINILEVGLGTGLNVLLTYLKIIEIPANIHYTALEAYPLDSITVKELNYIELLDAQQHQAFFDHIHSCEWEKDCRLSESFTLHKIKNTLQQVVFEKQFDIIYFDAFGPRVQPEMWTEEIFTKIYAATKPLGYMVTYCAKGEVKRTLKKVGFIVETLPGPPGKREMVRAVKE